VVARLGVFTPLPWPQLNSAPALPASPALTPNLIPPTPHLCPQTQELTETSERDGIPPGDVATLVGAALTAANPRQRYIVGTSAPVLHVMRRFLPDSIFHKVGVLGVRRACVCSGRGRTLAAGRAPHAAEPPALRPRPPPERATCAARQQPGRRPPTDRPRAPRRACPQIISNYYFKD
jgi:hypothetical protein